MVYLVTGGAGFIGRWVVKKLIEINKEVVVIDNLENSQKRNLEEFKDHTNLKEFLIEDIKNKEIVNKLFSIYKFQTCIHLAAQINVQESLENPKKAFDNNVVGTYNLLEASIPNNTKIILVGTCMVYDIADVEKSISENHPIRPISPYAGSKIAAEELALSFYYGLGLPVVVLRPFNTYGPFQKTNMEGGVIAIFVKRKLSNQNLLVYGDGNQTRDFLYVEDCAEFIVKASECEKCVGKIINAGSGRDISINDLAFLIVQNKNRIEHIEHHHPQSEINKLLCNNSRAKELLNWKPKISLKEGLQKFEKWIKENEMND